MIGLTVNDAKYWQPIQQVIDEVISKIPEGARVLEIGPGPFPFPRANVFVDWELKKLPKGAEGYVCDLGSDPLPFPDKSFDFIYCRHVLEDMFNPFALCAEMSRVGKAGYIETPSPLAEMVRGVERGSLEYRGYHHHRYVVWKHGDELVFVAKYPKVEYLELDDLRIVKELRDPYAWNTYYLWTDRVKVRHLQNPIDFFMPTHYETVINTAMGFV